MSDFRSQLSQVANEVPRMDATQLQEKRGLLEKKLGELNKAILALKDLEHTMNELKDDVEYHLSPEWLNETGSIRENRPLNMDDITKMTQRIACEARLERPKLQRSTNAVPMSQSTRPSNPVGCCLNTPIDQVMSSNVADDFPFHNDEESIESDAEDTMMDDHNTDHVIPLHQENVPKKYADMVDSLVGPE